MRSLLRAPWALLLVLVVCASPALACDTSDSADYECMSTLGQYTLYWNRPTEQMRSSQNPTVSMAFRVPAGDHSYFSFGWTPNGGMVGSYAVIAWVDGTNPDLGVYELRSKQSSGIVRTTDVASTLTRYTDTAPGGLREFQFDLEIKGAGNAAGAFFLDASPGVDNNMIWSIGRTTNPPGTLVQHMNRGFGTLNFGTQAAATQAPTTTQAPVETQAPAGNSPSGQNAAPTQAAATAAPATEPPSGNTGGGRYGGGPSGQTGAAAGACVASALAALAAAVTLAF
ncbi:unnamed protein product [Pedinophyceae sp. YPF-701]|nr:unnamed protein product [Pedinophyceae sp. YPF-701]